MRSEVEMSIASELTERFLRYVAVESQSDARATSLPPRPASKTSPPFSPKSCEPSA